MAENTSSFHLAVRGMSFQSIQVLRLCSSRAFWSLRTNYLVLADVGNENVCHGNYPLGRFTSYASRTP
jgi:hypothetical protein